MSKDSSNLDPDEMPTIPTPEAEARRLADPLLGTVLEGRFLLKMLLGRGGMGRVYLAEDQKLKRRVALKLMDPELSEQKEFKARFRREAVLQAQVSHPGIVQVLDLGESPEGAFIVLEFSDGQSLGNLLKLGKMALNRALDLFEQLLDVMDFAHKHDIVHRDLKPNNILIETRAKREIVRVLDFGIAKLASGGRSDTADIGMTLTQQGVGVGTIGYVALEQATGGPIDHRADIYSLGVILYQMLTGDMPHDSRSLSDYMISLAKNPVRPLAESHPALGIPGPIDQLIRHALARDPGERLPSALHFLDGIRAFRSGKPLSRTVAIDPGAAAAASRSAGRSSKRSWLGRYAPWAIAAGALGYAAFALTGGSVERRRLETALDQAEKRAGDFDRLDTEVKTFLSGAGIKETEAGRGLRAAEEERRSLAKDRETAVREQARLETELKSAQAALQKAGESGGTAVKDVERLNGEVARLGRELEAAKSQNGSASSALTKDLEDARKRLEDRQNELQAAKADVVRLGGEIVELRKRLDETERNLGSERDTRSRDAESFRLTRESLEAQVRTLREQAGTNAPAPVTGTATPPIRVTNRIRGKAVVITEVTGTFRSGESRALPLPQDKELLSGAAFVVPAQAGTLQSVRVGYRVRKADKSLDAPQSVAPDTILWKAGELQIDIGGS